MRQTIFIYFISIICFYPAVLSAQISNIRFEHLGLKEGLSQASPQFIMQDSQGFIWIGTQDGLNKFDGYKFTIYRYNRDNKTSLSDNFVHSIYEDSEGNLWIGTKAGLNKFDRKSETFIRYLNQPNNPESLSDNSVYSIFEDAGGNLWVGTFGGGLNKFDRQKEKFTHYKNQPNNPESLSNNNVRMIFEDAGANLWVATSGGLNKFDRKSEKFTHYKNQPNNPESLSNNNVRTIFEDTGGNLWVGTRGGLNKFDRKTETFIHYLNQADNSESISDNNVYSIIEDSGGNLWIGTYGGGLNKFDRQTETFIHYQYQSDNSASLSNDYIISIYEDTVGNLWIGTDGGGFNIFDRKTDSFTHYKKQNQLDIPKNLSDDSIWALYEDSNNNLWVGTRVGLNQFDRKTKTFTRYLNEPDNPLSLSKNYVMSIHEDIEGNLWVGTYGGGLNKFNLKTETFTHYQNQPDNPESLSNDYIISIYEDTVGNLWIGTDGGGLNKFDRKTDNFTHYKKQNQPDIPGSISNNTIWTLYEDSNNNLWVGTRAGLNKFDRKTKTFTRYLNEPSNSLSLSNNNVWSIFEDTLGNLWVGTNGGLNKLNLSDIKGSVQKKETFISYTKKDGLPNDVVYGILSDDKNNLWLSTNKGLSRFNPQTETFTNYDEKDGLQSNEFNVGAYHQDRSGRMYFGGINGFNEFFPDSIKDNTRIPPVVITDFLLFNKSVPVSDTSVLKQHINFTKEIIIDHNDYIFALEFSALNYRQPEKNQFAYKLEGFNENWIDTDYKNRRATYTNLSPGDYIFRVKGSNDDGYWNEEGASLKITVLPPWWASWWANSLYAIAFISAIWAFIFLRLRTTERQKRELQIKVNERTKELAISNQELSISTNKAEVANRAKSAFLANMSHELRTPLNSVLGFSELMSRDTDITVKQRSNLSTINRNGRHLLNMINDVLDLSKIESAMVKLRPTTIDLNDLHNNVIVMHKGLAKAKDLSLEFEDSPELPRYVIVDADKLRQIIINLLSNAIKFTDQGKVILRVQAEGSGGELRLCYEIEDSGIGIPVDKQNDIFKPFVRASNSYSKQKGTGLGLAIAQKQVQLMGGRLLVDSEEGKGALFHFDIAVQEAKGAEARSSASKVIGLAEDHPEWRILAVDDTPDNLQLLLQQLQDVGFNVRGAVNGIDAVQQFEQWQPHLIWMDMRMPEMDGYEASRRIRQLPGGVNVKIFALTAAAFKEQKADILKAGCDEVLYKPYQEHEIFDAMAKQLNIQFVYEDITKSVETVIDQRSHEYLAEILEKLPITFFDELKQAILLGEISKIKTLADSLRAEHSELAAWLREHAENYRITHLKQLISSGGARK